MNYKTRLTDAQRREYGLVAGRLFTPPQFRTPHSALRNRSALPTRNADPRSGTFINSVLSLNFQLA